MAVLTWRNVDAPQGGAAIQGIGLGAHLLDNASSGLSTALGVFGTAQTTLANNAAVQAASRFQTADGLSGALSDGSLISSLQGMGVDPSRVDAATINGLEKGVGDRVNNDLHNAQSLAATQKGQYDAAKMFRSNYDLGIAQQNQAGLNGIRDYQSEIQRRKDMGDEAGANAIMALPAYQQARRSVDPKTLADLDASGQTASGKFTSNSQGAFDLERGTQDRGNLLQSQRLLGEAQTRNLDGQGTYDYAKANGASQAVLDLMQKQLGTGTSITPGQGGVFGRGPAAQIQTAAGGGGTAMAPADFISQFGPAADAASKKTGIDANTILGQWGLETGWGKSIIPGTNNLGNIKSTDGTGVAAKDNQTGSIDKYQQFATPEAFGDAYSDLINNRYKGAANTGLNAAATAKALSAGGYATDPAYATKLINSAAMVNRARQGAPAPSASLAQGEQDVSAAQPGAAAPIDATAASPVAGAIASSLGAPRAAPTTVPNIDDIRADLRASASQNVGLNASLQQHQGQNIAATGIKASDYLAAQADGSSVKESAAKLANTKGGPWEGESQRVLQGWITQIVDASDQRSKTDTSVTKLTPAAATALLLHGNGVTKPGLPGTGILFGRTSQGDHLDDNTVNNLVGSINTGNITAAKVVEAGQNADQGALDDATKSFAAVAKDAQDFKMKSIQGGYKDPDQEARLAQRYDLAKRKMLKAQDKLNTGNNPQINTREAAVVQAAAAAKQAKVQTALDSFAGSNMPPNLY